MAEPVRRPDPAGDPSTPIVVLPPARPGGAPRRFVVRPGRVYALLAAVFIAGVAVAAAVAVAVLAPRGSGLAADNQALTARLAALQTELATWKKKVADALPTTPEPEPTRAGQLRVSIPALNGDEPTVRIALLRSDEAVVMLGDGLILEHEGGGTTPMRGQVRATPGKNSISIEGVGAVKNGLRVINRVGPVRVGDRELADTIELHNDGGRLLLIGELPLEKYLQGVVSSELPASWSLEAKKAQAVAARTYAMMQREQSDKPWHLESTVADQVYSGKAPDATSRAAVAATHGEILTAEGYLVSAFYHSTCGGKTEDPGAVWPGRPVHGNSSVTCGFCERAPAYRWSTDVTVDALMAAAKKDGASPATIKGLAVRSRSQSDRVEQIELVTDSDPISWGGNRFRELLGWTKVKSTLFQHEVVRGSFRLTGHGLGHGVGMCQWGAQGMSTGGHDYRAILSRYYPLAKVERIF